SACAARARLAQDFSMRYPLIDGALDRHRGNVSAAARELGLARNTVYRHLRRRRSRE
ncbi:helix-turn-helix domain-containing protein, partial [Burkholderia pseudomallei]|uniref:helix-turn-helix domain-containing protein n=1 Tax=Burkholderia pseudomallei TaxID=28450 RepID=UPI001177418B